MGNKQLRVPVSTQRVPDLDDSIRATNGEELAIWTYGKRSYARSVGVEDLTLQRAVPLLAAATLRKPKAKQPPYGTTRTSLMD